MVGYLIKPHKKMDTLNLAIKKFLVVFSVLMIFNCCTEEQKNKEVLNGILREFNYGDVYFKATDSLKTFQLNKLAHYDFLNCGQWYIDSLCCFNTKKDRIITCILYTNSNTRDATSDGIEFLLGEKIHGEWYFLKNASITIPREMAKAQDIHTPLSYQQLHKIALKEVYGGYLKPNGEINENWFTTYFEGPGWGDFDHQESSLKFLNVTEKFTDRRKFFEAIHLQSVKNNWLRRDTTQPILPLPQQNEKLP